ncbi:hypothetical protein CYMTET_8783 [Cymbomonas tetramitiformis]|uniref:Uncharacterized protein n=1 Tax=Cymbomonas tetramitiformis TaxID=36881 RepID=A0AAE0LG56_9CHLO|nr:hypothetical protein CYMTET_8783 [Cymbomonas tetramitiformis]
MPERLPWTAWSSCVSQVDLIQQVRERCRHREQKTHDWYFDSTNVQVARELELARFTKSLVTVLTDYNALLSTVFDLTDIHAPVLPEASRLVFRIYEILLRGSAQSGTRGFSCQFVVRWPQNFSSIMPHRCSQESGVSIPRILVQDRAPTITMLAGVDPKPHTETFLEHCTAAPRETVFGLSAEAIWGVGFGIDLLARRMCPVYYKDLLIKYDKNTEAGRLKQAQGLVMFTLEVEAFHHQQTEAGALLKQKKKQDSASALAASILSIQI